MNNTKRDRELFKIICLGYDKYRVFHAFDRKNSTHLGKVCVELDTDDYPRYKNLCNGKNIAKIVRVETEREYCGYGVASAIIRRILYYFYDYNFILLCSPSPRGHNDTLKIVTDLKKFYSKFGFKKTNELLPTMIRTADVPFQH